MAKLNLNDIGTSFQARQALNDNFLLIEQALENTLSRDGTAPNELLADLNLNNRSIINISNAFLSDGRSILVLTNEAEASAQASANSATASEASRQASDQSAANALASEQQADQHRANALLSRNQAEDLKDETLGFRDETNQYRLDTLGYQNTTLGYRNEAETFKDQSLTNKQATDSNLNTVQGIDGQLQSIYTSVLEAQAQTNALLGLGIGSSFVDPEGNLIMFYNDATVDNIEINNQGQLVIEY